MEIEKEILIFKKSDVKEHVSESYAWDLLAGFYKEVAAGLGNRPGGKPRPPADSFDLLGRLTPAEAANLGPEKKPFYGNTRWLARDDKMVIAGGCDKVIAETLMRTVSAVSSRRSTLKNAGKM